MKKKVLFLCVHNSARSQMAEAFLNRICRDDFEATSAGLEPGRLNPHVVEVLREVGLDIAGKKTTDIFEVFKSGQKFDYVITVCDEANAERCPIFPGATKRLHWGFPDPSSFKGSREEILEETRGVRDAIKEKIEAWCSEMCVSDRC